MNAWASLSSLLLCTPGSNAIINIMNVANLLASRHSRPRCTAGSGSPVDAVTLHRTKLARKTVGFSLCVHM